MVNDLKGQKFGRLTVIERAKKENERHAVWLCICDCGNYVTVKSDNLKSGNSKSCGCLAKELTRQRSLKHGEFGSRLYNIWAHMKNRCNNPSDKRYKDYGGRGITFCKEWNDFESFRDWASANGYRDDLTIDRIDVNGNYEPSNCRWATIEEQANNKRNNLVYTLNGRTQTLAQWCEEYGMNYFTVYRRLGYGWDISKALDSLYNCTEV